MNPGTYGFTVADSQGCQASSSVTIYPRSGMNFFVYTKKVSVWYISDLNNFIAVSHGVASHSNVLCHGGYGSVVLSGSGGTGVYNYNVFY